MNIRSHPHILLVRIQNVVGTCLNDEETEACTCRSRHAGGWY